MVEKRYDPESTGNAAAALEILTGPARGTVCWLGGAALDVSLDDKDVISVFEAGKVAPENSVVARLHRSGDSFEIEACEPPLWINGQRVEATRLESRDLIEFGDRGPLSRFRIHRQGDRLKRSLADMLYDCIDYARVSRKPRFTRLQKALRDFLSDFVIETTLLFRVSVVFALVALTIVTYQQYRSDLQLQQQATSSADKLEDFARSLTLANQEALRPADLNRLRREFGSSLSDTAARLELLEQRSEASTRIIAGATRSIVFLQGSYAFRDVESGRMLRYQTDEEGNLLYTLHGQLLLALEGDGEVAERAFTGTGFVVSNSGALLTNRHVALPWEDDTNLEALAAEGMEPLMIKFIGYLPGVEAAFPVELLMASVQADVAILTCSDVVGDLPRLTLGTNLPEPGDEVIVMGYPTGMRAMLAQTGDDFLSELQPDQHLDFWEVARQLSRSQFIRPLASRGIVAQRSESTVIYDADTTHGGSGGPVLDVDGNAVAINAAVIPEYGGSNFGVPIKYARQLLVDAGISIE